MLMKNMKSGETETMRYDPAMAAVAAGTHEIVNIDEQDQGQGSGESVADLSRMTKDELLAEAQKRGVEVKASDTKAEIIDAIAAA